VTFALQATDGTARAGLLQTDHGAIETPIFMPVGTQGTVKAVEQRELREAGAQIILGNTYHLYLRPGTAILRELGGLHRFMNWDRPILTDSGGYQVFSLTDLRTISEEGVTFRSHLDGSTHLFTPESVVGIQRAMGSDVMMVLDECAPYPCDEAYARASNEMTVRWAARCRDAVEHQSALYGHRQALFGIVQGSVYPAIREESARALVDLDFDGYAIGGLAVGEQAELMYELTAFTTPMLPSTKPRYLMGVGTPENIVESIARGVDMFDCVMPTRNARNGNLFTKTGPLNLRNSRHKAEEASVEEGCPCYCCRTHSRAYLRHLFMSREILALQLATIHNITFYLRLVTEARKAILSGTFEAWRQKFHATFRRERESAKPE
jgi:queuine tRNA-ribosyltransferase